MPKCLFSLDRHHPDVNDAVDHDLFADPPYQIQHGCASLPGWAILGTSYRTTTGAIVSPGRSVPGLSEASRRSGGLIAGEQLALRAHGFSKKECGLGRHRGAREDEKERPAPHT